MASTSSVYLILLRSIGYPLSGKGEAQRHVRQGIQCAYYLCSYSTKHNYETKGHTFCGLAMLQYSLSPTDWTHFPVATPTAKELSSHAPPLFVHANLLKHSAGYRKDEVWTTLKRMKEDRVNSNTDYFRSTVYTSARQGMCVDIWDAFDDVNPRKDGTFENGRVIVENARTALGGVFAGFEEM